LHTRIHAPLGDGCKQKKIAESLRVFRPRRTGRHSGGL
jgi:hypothetical protein